MSEKFPKIKSVFPWYRVESNILIEAQDGLSHKIADPVGHFELLLSLLDGTRNLDNIVEEFRNKFNDVSKDDILDIISNFDDMRLLENKTTPPEHFDEYKLERYSRNIGFFELYSSLNENKFDFQDRLCNAKVALLGVGGVGSHIALSLVGLGVGEVTILDYDDVDLSNLNRQILYKESDIGKPKIYAAAERMKEFGSRTKVIPINKQITSAKDVELAVKGCDIVLAAVDRPKTTIISWINEGCIAANVPFVTGGVDRDRAVHYTVLPGITGCTECWQKQVEETDNTYDEIRRQMVAYEETGVRFGQDFAGIYPLVALQAAALTAELVRVITKVTEPLARGRVMSMSFENLVLKEAESWTRKTDCPVCKHLNNEKTSDEFQSVKS